ncbi:MAG: hypothetical protein Ct9H300mP4_08250 [Gammaproteobacteria bacterium]|nr:MAG: hypothetical protein Ct9H300mP4_08250 [Gammaproteobacteria bacterium]
MANKLTRLIKLLIKSSTIQIQTDHVSAWNVADLPDETISPQENVAKKKGPLAPCHAFFQFFVREEITLPTLPKEVGTFLGLGFNIASYSFSQA